MQAEAESWPSVAELEQEGVSQLLQSEAEGQLQQRYTFLYAQAPDLRMDDVPVLLRQYKELILKHEALVCAIQAHRAKQQSAATATPAPGTARLLADQFPYLSLMPCFLQNHKDSVSSLQHSFTDHPFNSLTLVSACVTKATLISTI